MTVAVAIALYNGEKYIVEQLETLRNQTKAIDQLILCDDGSKDNTREIVASYIKKYNLEDKWELVLNESNLGFIKNFYKALSLCNQDLIFLADQDDVWELEKIEKMVKIMEENDTINLLSCEYGIIDANGETISSFMERGKQSDEQIASMSVVDILKAWNRPGMTMCVRKSFFDRIYPSIKDVAVPHDYALAICAADIDSFYVYNYIGAYHRRHNNNAAREEHRIFKLLNLERKKRDIKEWIDYVTSLVSAHMPISESAYALIEQKQTYLHKRLDILENRKLFAIFSLIKEDKLGLYRKVAIICDIWIVCFGKYKNRE
ncbi:MAG: glycosyltransferase [Agathobacter sp.]|nr:glycosyltransferase [Agathobacter sp.]